MIKIKLFRDRQEARAGDFTDMQTFARDTFGHLVRDAVTDDLRYKALTVAKTANTEVSVGTGRVYQNGAIYDRDVETTRDLIAELPVANSKYVSVVAYGNTVQTSVEPRDFLVSIDDGTTEPQTVAMDETRRAEIGFISGSEGVSPVPPTVPAGQVRVANVLLGPSGIVSITQVTSNILGGLEGANKKVGDLTAWRGQIGPRVDALQSTLADVRGTLADKAPMKSVSALYEALAQLRRETSLPAGIADWAYDNFRDGSRTDDTPADTAYRLDGILNFPDSGAVTTSLDLFNVLDAQAHKTAGGMLLPSFDPVVAIQTEGQDGELNLSTYTSATTTTEQYTTYKTVTRTGSRREGNNWQNIQQITVQNHEHNVTTVFDRDRESHLSRSEWGALVERVADTSTGSDVSEVTDFSYATEKYTYQQRQPVTRTRQVSNTQTYTGLTLGQTILSPRLMWITSIGLNFTGLDSSGDVTVLLTGTDSSGRPNREDVKSRTTVAYADLKAGVETSVVLEPALVEAGERIAVILVTPGSHKHAVVNDTETLQGEVLYADAQGWQYTADDKSLLVSLYAAKFRRSRAEVRLLDVNLSGGIQDLRVATETVAPEGTTVNYEYQIGGIWHPFANGTPLVTNLPSTVPIRAVFNGTSTMQPAITLGAGKVEGTVVGTSLVHYSTLRQLPATSDEVVVDVVCDYFDNTNHTLTLELLDADNADAVVSAAVVKDVSVTEYNLPDGTTTAQTVIRRRATFNPTAIQNYRIRITGAHTASAARPFNVLERLDHAV